MCHSAAAPLRAYWHTVSVYGSLYGDTEKDAPGGSTENRWLSSSLPGRTAQCLLPQKGQFHSERLITRRSQTVWTVTIRQEIQVHKKQDKQTTKLFLPNSHYFTKLYQSIVLAFTFSIFHLHLLFLLSIVIFLCIATFEENKDLST